MKINLKKKSWPLNQSFNISRGKKTEALTLEVNLMDNGYIGRGECVPYARYDESFESVFNEINNIKVEIENGLVDNGSLQSILKPGAARNALDCALWDLKFKKNLKTSWEFLDIPKPSKIKTCYTIVLDEPKKMALDAKQHSNYPILKIKVGENNLKESMLAIREVAPSPKIILDANEDLSVRSLDKLLDFLVKMNVSLIEQPVLSTEDNELEYLDTPIPLCADESFHNYDDIENIFKRYEYINIKLDKTGGLTEGLKIAKRAKELEKGIMIGCMVGSSLSMLPALMLYEYANYIDLDGPCFLKKDEDYGLIYNEGLIKLPKQVCWG